MSSGISGDWGTYATIAARRRGERIASGNLTDVRAPHAHQQQLGRIHNADAGTIHAAIDAAVAASFIARDGLRATWAYRSLVARNLVLEFIEERTQEVA